MSISSSASDNDSVVFGQSYQHQVTTSGTYSGTVTYSLSNQPDGMTISSSGLIEWTPTKASQITTHSDITITLTTASSYVISNFLGNITAYTDNASSGDICARDNASDCTAENNYAYYNSSLHLKHGPTPSATKGSIFFYNQYDNTTNIYLFFFFGDAGNSNANTLKLDVFSENNSTTDNVEVSDDSGETTRYTSSTYCGTSTTCYKGRYSYNSQNSDGAVIGPYSGTDFKIFVDIGGTSTINSDTLTLGNLDSFKYFSKDGSSFSLGDVDNFTVGYSTSMDCSN